MKKYLPFLILCFNISSLSAQDIRLNDSVIFINNTPVALYSKQISNTIPRYDMEVYNFADYILIKAEVIKFNAPVRELKPFYYYELSFPSTTDTFSMYVEDEAFPLVMAGLIRDYQLISKNELNKEAVAAFIKTYPGGPALTAKIKGVEDYLDETRHYREQVERDRTKPVYIVNNKVIMQDSVKIGTFNSTFINPSIANKTNQIQVLEPQQDYNENFAGSIPIYFKNDRLAKPYREIFFGHLRKGDIGYELYLISKTKKLVPGSIEDLMLQRICSLIEDFDL